MSMDEPLPVGLGAVPRQPAVAESGNLAVALEALAARQPQRPLMYAPGQRAATWDDLRAQAALVREQLHAGGFAAGDLIVGCIQSRPCLALACATLPVASTFVPLATTLALAEYRALFDRLRPRAVLTDGDAAQPFTVAARERGIARLHAAPIVAASCGRFRLELLDGCGPAWTPRRVGPQCAYLVVTSGTTGRPKIVPAGHRQLIAFLGRLTDWLRLIPDDVGCSVMPFHFAGGLRGTLLATLASGGSVVCLPERDVTGLVEALGTYGVTWFGASFAIHRELLRRCAENPVAVAGNRLRFVRVTAGRLEGGEIEQLSDALGAPVVAGYGTTESPGIAHDPLPPDRAKAGSAGKAMAGEVVVLDAAGQRCATGVVGEIAVSSPFNFDGYIDDDRLSAATLVDGWYRTGDVGLIDADGYVFLQGRGSELINRGGEKIAPVDIDRALEAIPGVAEAAAFAVPHRSLGQELVAAVVRRAGAEIDQEAILDRLRQLLPMQHMPRAISFIAALPRTESGKVRRAVLAEAFGSGTLQREASDAALDEAPATPVEIALAPLWAAVLRAGPVPRNANFFLLGGDSLSGMQLLASADRAFAVKLPRDVLFGGAATLAGMAKAIEKARGGAR